MKKILLSLLSLIIISAVSAANMNVVSDTTNEYYDGSNWQSAVATWVHSSWPTISGATWIWNSYYITDPSQDETVKFRKTFSLPVCNAAYSGSIDITTDNEYVLKINGNLVGADTNWQTVENYDISSDLVAGSNVIEIEAKNRKCSTDNIPPSQCTVYSNPAGVAYSANIEHCENEIPEFTAIGASLALIGVGLFIYRKQRLQ